MKHLMFAVAVIVFIVGMAFLTTDKDKTRILNAFANQDMGVPEWIEIDWSNETKTKESYQITYGLGGRTCHSIVEFDVNGHMEEHARRCDY